MAFSILSWKKSEAGFVGGILVIILAVSVVQLRVGQMKARDAQRKADAQLVGRALEAYFIEHDEYPSEEEGQILACGGKAMQECEWGGENLGDAEGMVYLKKLPQDPRAHDGYRYVYEVNETKQKFRIYTAVEYRRDPAYKADLTVRCGENVQCNWYVEN